MAHNPKRVGTGATILITLLILAMIAATGFLIWMCIDLANQDAGHTQPADTSIALPQAGTESTEAQPEETEPPVTTEPPVPESVVATATISTQGDLLMHSPVFATAKQSDGSYDFENIFRYSKDLVSSADYAIANLETTFGGPEHPHQPNQAFCCPDELAANAVEAGYDMLITANNHSGDSMGDGVIRTLEVAREAGLATLGSQLPGEKRYSIVEVNGIKVGMVGYTWAFKGDGSTFSLNGLLAIKDEGQMNYFMKTNPDKLYKEAQEIMDQMKADGAEATMIQIHWGEEYEITENALQNKIAQKLCDIGFDVIVGGHPHVVQPMELLTSTEDPEHKTVCIYSLGNAVSNQRAGISEKFPSAGYTEDGVFFTTTFEKYSDGKVYLAGIDVIPTWVNMHSNQGTKEYNILPLILEEEESWKESYQLTDHNFTSCQRSYKRTMDIVSEGLEACQDYLEQAKADREQYYHDLAFFPERFEAAEEAVEEPTAAETLANAA
nr:CapA family protein [Oscillospiraceae bacterium]